jgi:hypothetical protein
MMMPKGDGHKIGAPTRVSCKVIVASVELTRRRLLGSLGKALRSRSVSTPVVVFLVLGSLAGLAAARAPRNLTPVPLVPVYEQQVTATGSGTDKAKLTARCGSGGTTHAGAEWHWQAHRLKGVYRGSEHRLELIAPGTYAFHDYRPCATPHVRSCGPVHATYVLTGPLWESNRNLPPLQIPHLSAVISAYCYSRGFGQMNTEAYVSSYAHRYTLLVRCRRSRRGRFRFCIVKPGTVLTLRGTGAMTYCQSEAAFTAGRELPYPARCYGAGNGDLYSWHDEQSWTLRLTFGKCIEILDRPSACR